MVCVFDPFTKQNEFNTCGERILSPTSCKIHQEENGDWSLELHQPILPNDDCYKFLKPYSIIKVTSGQLFPVYWLQKKMENGIPTLIVKAKHIFYYLSDKLITEEIQTTGENGWSCWTVVDQLFEKARIVQTDQLCEYTFSHSSDIGTWNHYNAKIGTSIAKGLFECCDVWGGYLYRDNFNLSIRSVMEGSRDNSFTAEHGWNVSEITETIDYSTRCTEMFCAENGTINFYESLVPVWGGSFPHQKAGFVEFNYSDGASNFANDSTNYWNQNTSPSSAYDINLITLTDTSRALGWDGFERVKVGDRGKVFSNLLGVDTDQRVVSIDFDELTQRNTNVKIQGFQHSSSLHPGRYAAYISSGNNAETKRIANLEKKSGYFTYVED